MNMTAASKTRAVLIEMRETDTRALQGGAVFVAGERFASVVFEDNRVRTAELSVRVWEEIDAWLASGDAGLPARPAPLSAAVVAALGVRGGAIVAERVASIPLSIEPQPMLNALAERLLAQYVRTH